MPGEIKDLIDEIIRIRSNGSPGIEPFVRAQLLMKGIDPDTYNASSPDDPEMLGKLELMKSEFPST